VLVAMVGAIVMTRAHRVQVKRQDMGGVAHQGRAMEG